MEWYGLGVSISRIGDDMQRHNAHDFDPDNWPNLGQNITNRPLIFTDIGSIMELRGTKGDIADHDVISRADGACTVHVTQGILRLWRPRSGLDKIGHDVDYSAGAFAGHHNGNWPEQQPCHFECKSAPTVWRCFHMTDDTNIDATKSTHRVYNGQGAIIIPNTVKAMVTFIGATTSIGSGDFMALFENEAANISMTAGWAWVVQEATSDA